MKMTRDELYEQVKKQAELVYPYESNNQYDIWITDFKRYAYVNGYMDAAKQFFHSKNSNQ